MYNSFTLSIGNSGIEKTAFVFFALASLLAVIYFIKLFIRYKLKRADAWPVLLSSSGFLIIVPVIQSGGRSELILSACYLIVYVLFVSLVAYPKSLHKFIILRNRSVTRGHMHMKPIFVGTVVTMMIAFGTFMKFLQALSTGTTTWITAALIMSVILLSTLLARGLLILIVPRIGISKAFYISFALLLLSQVLFISPERLPLQSLLGYSSLSFGLGLGLPLLHYSLAVEGNAKSHLDNLQNFSMWLLAGQVICWYFLLVLADQRYFYGFNAIAAILPIIYFLKYRSNYSVR